MGTALPHGPTAAWAPQYRLTSSYLALLFLTSLPVGYASEEEETENPRKMGRLIVIIMVAVSILACVACCGYSKVCARKLLRASSPRLTQHTCCPRPTSQLLRVRLLRVHLSSLPDDASFFRGTHHSARPADRPSRQPVKQERPRSDALPHTRDNHGFLHFAIRGQAAGHGLAAALFPSSLLFSVAPSANCAWKRFGLRRDKVETRTQRGDRHRRCTFARRALFVRCRRSPVV
jgi:hypothetical protein